MLSRALLSLRGPRGCVYLFFPDHNFAYLSNVQLKSAYNIVQALRKKLWKNDYNTVL